MEKLIKDVILCTVKDLRCSSADEVNSVISRYRCKTMGVLVTDGKTDRADTNHGVFLAKDIRLVGSFVFCDLIVLDERYIFLHDLDSLNGLFGWVENNKLIESENSITFIPVKNKEGDLSHFSLNNKFSNIEKMREYMKEVSETNQIDNIKSGDKFLDLNINFKLPRGFKGDMSDAIFALYKYSVYSNKDLVCLEDSGTGSKFEKWYNNVNLYNEPYFGDAIVKTFLG